MSSLNQDSIFNDFKNYYVDEIFRINPGMAAYAGKHDYDSILLIPSIDLFKQQCLDWEKLGDSLSKFDEKQLSALNKIDFYMMRDNLESNLWYTREYKDFEWDPSGFNVSYKFAEIMNGKHAALEERLAAIFHKLKNVPAYYAAAKQLIKTPVIEHTDLAIVQHEASAEEIFGKSFRDSVNVSLLKNDVKAELLLLAESAGAAMNDYLGWLKEKRKALTPENSRSFRLGRELYEKKFELDIISSYSANDIYAVAVTRRKELLGEITKLSRQLWPKYFGDEKMPDDSMKLNRKLIDRLSLSHVKPDSFLQEIEKQIPQLVTFVNDKKLLYIDPSKPLVVRKNPAYMEGGGAGASISAPGPFDKNANTYYNVSPLTGYSPDAAESYLREYNDYLLPILNIHEAIPGHYTQLVYSNNSPSIIKSIFGNGAMIEGWAVYAERMMIENGYGNHEPEMWLMYYKWHLRAVTNTILDYNVHVLNMGEAEAKKMMIEEAFQQQTEADGKWRRAKLTQVQLCSYFTGFTEIYNLREAIKQKEKDHFDLAKFHEKFLSYGSAPVKYIKELMEVEAAGK